MKDKIFLQGYLRSILWHEVGDIKLTLEQEHDWEFCSQTGQPYAEGAAYEVSRLCVHLEFNSEKKYEYEDCIGSLVVKECTLFTERYINPLYRTKILCLKGKETDNLFKYALGA